MRHVQRRRVHPVDRLEPGEPPQPREVRILVLVGHARGAGCGDERLGGRVAGRRAVVVEQLRAQCGRLLLGRRLQVSAEPELVAAAARVVLRAADRPGGRRAGRAADPPRPVKRVRQRRHDAVRVGEGERLAQARAQRVDRGDLAHGQVARVVDRGVGRRVGRQDQPVAAQQGQEVRQVLRVADRDEL